MTIGLTTALIASVTALLAAGLTYISTSRKDQLQARIEICKYREKWLDTLRTDLVNLHTLYLQGYESPLNEDRRWEFLQIMTKITLSVNESNTHWHNLEDEMGHMFDCLVKVADRKSKAGDVTFVEVAKQILKEEWDEIQNLLEGKQRNKNDKN